MKATRTRYLNFKPRYHVANGSDELGFSFAIYFFLAGFFGASFASQASLSCSSLVHEVQITAVNRLNCPAVSICRPGSHSPHKTEGAERVTSPRAT